MSWMARCVRTIWRKEAWVVPVGSPISRARSALPTFTMEALAAAAGSVIQPMTVTTGSSPCQE